MEKNKINYIRGNIENLYFIPFICGCKNINEASIFLKENANIDIKLSNFTKKINLLIEKKYLILVNDPYKTKYFQKIINVNKDLIINDIINELKSITNNFTYQFKIDGKNIIKKKHFSYDKECDLLEEKLKNKLNKNILLKIFINFIKIVLINKAKKEKINRKSKNFTYNQLIQQFIEFFSLNKKFIDEYNSYIDNEQIIILNNKKISLKNNNFINYFKKVCKNYKLIKGINENSFYIGLILK